MSYSATAFAFLLLLVQQSTVAIGFTWEVTEWCGTDGSCQDQPAGLSDHERNAALLQVGHQVSSEKPSNREHHKDEDAKASLSLGDTHGAQKKTAGKKNTAAGKDKKAASKEENAEAKHKSGANDKKAAKRGKKALLQTQESRPTFDSSLISVKRWENSNSNTRVTPMTARALKPKKVSRKVSYANAPMHSDMTAMEKVEALVDRIGGIITNKRGMQDFAASLEKDPNYRPPTSKIVHGMRKAASNEDGWLRLPSPEKGPILYHMIRSDPWDCDLVPPTDRRALTCRVPIEDSTLNPHSLTCSVDDACAIEHANSFRTLFNVGSLPCCQTPPYCAAPTCSTTFAKQKSAKKAPSCSQRTPEENVAYMKDPKSWPAYHGWGGAFEMDTLKLMDVLTCLDGHDCPDKTFDLILDLGANSGYYTEKLTVRNFGKNYVLIEANPGTAGLLNERFGNEDWKKAWFEKQVPHKGGEWPEFEIITKALSNHSEGTLDMCQTENSLAETPAGCIVPIGSVDDIVPSKLSTSFQDHFKNAESMFIKVDTEGMDELVLRGMKGLLNETRGRYHNHQPRHLVNFLQFEFAPVLTRKAKEREQFDAYDIKTVTKFLESIGFESFLMGPRYLPMSHGSWHDDYKVWTEDPSNNAGTRLNYPDFPDTVCWWCQTMDEASFTADVFAIRSSHPHAAEIKLALGACEESKDFDIHDPQYAFGEDI